MSSGGGLFSTTPAPPDPTDSGGSGPGGGGTTDDGGGGTSGNGGGTGGGTTDNGGGTTGNGGGTTDDGGTSDGGTPGGGTTTGPGETTTGETTSTAPPTDPTTSAPPPPTRTTSSSGNSVTVATTRVVISQTITTESQVSRTLGPGGNSDDHSSSGGLSTGAETGIIVGCSVGGGLILLGLLWFCISRYRRRGSKFNSNKILWPELGAQQGREAGFSEGLFPESVHRTGGAGVGADDDMDAPGGGGGGMRESGGFSGLAGALVRGFSRRGQGGHNRQPTLPNVGPVEEYDEPDVHRSTSKANSNSRSGGMGGGMSDQSHSGYGSSGPYPDYQNPAYSGAAPPAAGGYWPAGGYQSQGVPPGAGGGQYLTPNQSLSIPYNPPSSTADSHSSSYPLTGGGGNTANPNNGGQQSVGLNFGRDTPVGYEGHGGSSGEPSPPDLDHGPIPRGDDVLDHDDVQDMAETGTLDSRDERRESGAGRLAVVN